MTLLRKRRGSDGLAHGYLAMEGLAYGKAAPMAGNTATSLMGAWGPQQCHGLKTKLLTQGP